MKLGKIFLLGAVLAAVSPFAVADTITTTGTTINSGITSTGITFGGKLSGGPFNNDAAGTVASPGGSGAFAPFGTGIAMYYTPGLISTNVAMHFADPTVGTPLHFYEIVGAGGVTLDLYLTSVLTHTIGSVSTPGGFTASGYFTESTTGSTHYTFDSFSLTDTTAGTTVINSQTVSGPKSFTTTLIYTPIASTPEPSSLVLLGSGAMGMAGIVFRRRRTL